MKYERSERCKADFQGLSDSEKALFWKAVPSINEAYTNRGNLALPRWPRKLRIKDLEGYSGLFEMTWSFSGPDGRATFEYVTVQGEPAIKWRRIGTHRIFEDP